LTAGAVAVALVAGVLTLFSMQPASANHGTRTLQASPEVASSVPVGSPQVVTVTLSSAADSASGSIPVDAEIFNGPADNGDGKAPQSPDAGCTVAVGSATCQFSVTATTPGASEVGIWIDHDNRNEIGQGGVTELDQGEGRLADGSPDGNPQAGAQTPSSADCRAPEDYAFSDSPPVGTAGGCGADVPPPAGQAGVAEPDTTDVIQLNWGAAKSLDCDTTNGTDRIVDSDDVNTTDADVTIVCVYRGNGTIRVDGANISGTDTSTISDPGGANDPNGTGGIDYTCENTSANQCEITVGTPDNQTGPAILCFWVDGNNDGAFAPAAGGSGNGDDGQGCSDERVDDPENDDNTDRVQVRWGAAPVATTLDVTPESGSSNVGTVHALVADVTDQYGDPMTAATPVSFEFVAASPGDPGDDDTPESVDKACQTSNGRCAIAYEVTKPGVDVICGWVGTAPTLTGTSPGGNCNTETVSGDTRGNIDVVTWNWTTPPASGGGGGGGGTAEDVAKTQGYTLVGADGGIYNFGTSQFKGSTGDLKLNQPVIGLANKRGGTGYWLVAKDGGIFTFGDAEFFGSTGDKKLNAPILGMEATPSGKGYWLFAADGGIFTFGDAAFYGSTGDMKLNAPAVGLAVNDKGDGYWLVAQDGGIFSFGNVPFHGSTGSMKLNQPVFDMTPTAGDKGYWLVAKDGGIFSFGDASDKFYGSAVGATSATVIGIGATPTFNGYWIADSAGGVFPFGDARALGDRRGQTNNAPIVGFATVPKA
jgi:hypothetical protein